MSSFVSFLRKGPVPALRQKPAPAVTEHERSLVFAAASLLLAYPTDSYGDVLDAVDEAAADLDQTVADELTAFTCWARRVGTRAVETAYVDTFDRKRRCALELTYYATGDTRQRGIALTVFSDLYAACGFAVDNKELPDFLPNLLELAARVTDPVTTKLINEVIASHREGIEVLHAALGGIDSPFAHVVAAIRMVLPAVDDATMTRLNTLIRKGPPQELVGLDSQELPWPVSQPATT